ncbi:MAG: DNA translocase FtsK [Parafilimonas sp.]
MFKFIKKIFTKKKITDELDIASSLILNLVDSEHIQTVELNNEIKKDNCKIEPSVVLKEETEIDAVKLTNSYEPTLDLSNYKYPSLDLLEAHGSEKIVHDPNELEANKNQIISTLKDYDIQIQRISATVGPTVTLYEILPAPGVRISRIKNLEDDIALSLAALGIRIIAPIPGKGAVGIEVPNVRKTVVSMKTLLSSEKFQNNNFSLPIAIGKKIDNENFIVDLATMPHLLMAGATGQGKSVGINTLLASLLYKKHPSQLKFILMDVHRLEFGLYRNIEKHFLAKLPHEEDPIITDSKKAIITLNALATLMNIRYDLLKEASCRNIKEYNEKFVERKLNPQKGHEFLPFIVLVIDELDEFLKSEKKEIESILERITMLGAKVGIHSIIAVQRPSANIVSGTLKSNFQTRIAFKTSSRIDSDIIIEQSGAEQLIGKGDMLISYNGEITRVQCAFIDTPEVEKICEFIGDQQGYPQAYQLPEYTDEKELEAKGFDLTDRDALFEDAARLIVQNQMGSTSLIQRRMKLGYNRAGRLMDQLEQAGVVGPNLGSKARDVIVKTEGELQELLDIIG